MADWDMVNGLAQTAGALGTLGALIVGIRTFNQKAADDRRAQASHVTVEIFEPIPDANPPIAIFKHRVRVHNASPLPIYNLQLRSKNRQMNWWKSVEGQSLQSVRPGTGGDLYIDPPPWGSQLEDVTGVEFADAAGRSWLRVGDGDLRAAYYNGKLFRLLERQSKRPSSATLK